MAMFSTVSCPQCGKSLLEGESINVHFYSNGRSWDESISVELLPHPRDSCKLEVVDPNGSLERGSQYSAVCAGCNCKLDLVSYEQV